jgi:citrate lyase subunit beta / citryl-CoA lyase
MPGSNARALAVARGRGVVVLDGRLIENLHVDDAGRVLALADAIVGLGGAAMA